MIHKMKEAGVDQVAIQPIRPTREVVEQVASEIMPSLISASLVIFDILNYEASNGITVRRFFKVAATEFNLLSSKFAMFMSNKPCI